MNLTHFKFYTKQVILSHTRLRKFETKLGERISFIDNTSNFTESLSHLKAKYVVFGIPEDIGVQANIGIPGTSSAWSSFLKYFLNIQSNDFLAGDDIAVIGHFDFSELQTLIEQNAYNADEKIEAFRHAVNAVDDEVESMTKLLTAAGKVPIAIGGGHNNAYPLIKGAAKGLNGAQKLPLQQINCINLDAHADYRPIEGRHSGNAFRYADEDGFLQKYCVIGLQENYLQQNVWMDIVNNPFIDCITFEDIFIHEKRTFRQAIEHALDFTSDNFYGIELDLDSIENVLSSAKTPSGISAMDARKYVTLAASSKNAAYLHICEGAAALGTEKNEATGKLISYLVCDFIKMNSSQGEA